LSLQEFKDMKKIFVMLTVLVVAACATVAKATFKEPVITFRDLQVQGIGLNGGALDVVLSVYNPNQFRLDATRLTYRLTIDTTTLGEGVYDSKFTVNEGDSTIVHLPITLSYAGLASAGKQLLGKGTVDYRVSGDVTVSTPIGDFTQPYSRTGRFSNLSGTSRVPASEK
jgi:LEA14-like dessication related protein